MTKAAQSAEIAYRARHSHLSTEDPILAKPNYSFEKRQRELAKKQKKAEKLQRKAMPGDAPDQVEEPQTEGDAPAVEGAAEA